MMIEAAKLKTGMTFWDGSLIEVLSETNSFVTVRLSNGRGMKGKSVEKKVKKTSLMKLAK